MSLHLLTPPSDKSFNEFKLKRKFLYCEEFQKFQPKLKIDIMGIKDIKKETGTLSILWKQNFMEWIKSIKQDKYGNAQFGYERGSNSYWKELANWHYPQLSDSTNEYFDEQKKYEFIPGSTVKGRFISITYSEVMQKILDKSHYLTAIGTKLSLLNIWNLNLHDFSKSFKLDNSFERFALRIENIYNDDVYIRPFKTWCGFYLEKCCLADYISLNYSEEFSWGFISDWVKKGSLKLSYLSNSIWAKNEIVDNNKRVRVGHYYAIKSEYRLKSSGMTKQKLIKTKAKVPSKKRRKLNYIFSDFQNILLYRYTSDKFNPYLNYAKPNLKIIYVGVDDVTIAIAFEELWNDAVMFDKKYNAYIYGSFDNRIPADLFIDSREGNDTLCGKEGNNLLGDLGNDYLIGGNGSKFVNITDYQVDSNAILEDAENINTTDIYNLNYKKWSSDGFLDFVNKIRNNKSRYGIITAGIYFSETSSISENYLGWNHMHSPIHKFIKNISIQRNDKRFNTPSLKASIYRGKSKGNSLFLSRASKMVSSENKIDETLMQNLSLREKILEDKLDSKVFWCEPRIKKRRIFD